MSLESVFAALGGWLILSEALTPVELLGCALVFAAVMLAQVPDFIENARRKRMAEA
jgi:drug/metabolite transporter (DMT)-like permease